MAKSTNQYKILPANFILDKIETKERLNNSSKILDNNCIVWTGSRSKRGYGQIKINGIMFRTHRIAMAIYKDFSLGSLDHILHKCDNPPCINPDHLYTGTQFDNENDKLNHQRNKNAEKTECKFGHKFTPLNTKEWIKPNGKKFRQCKTCLRQRDNKRYQSGLRKHNAKI